MALSYFIDNIKRIFFKFIASISSDRNFIISVRSVVHTNRSVKELSVKIVDRDAVDWTINIMLTPSCDGAVDSNL
jgi:hypothetical protein